MAIVSRRTRLIAEMVARDSAADECSPTDTSAQLLLVVSVAIVVFVVGLSAIPMAAAHAQLRPLTATQRDSILRSDSIYWTNYRSKRTLPNSTLLWSPQNTEAFQAAAAWLTSPVLFHKGTSHVQGDAIDELRLKSRLLRENPDLHVTLIGNSDSVGSADIRRGVAAARAQDVRRFLLATGVDSQQVKIAYFPPNNVIPGTDLWLDRRVDFSYDSKPQSLYWNPGTAVLLAHSGLPNVISTVDTTTDFFTVRIPYVTDRKRRPSFGPDSAFGNERLDTLVYGRAIVTVPASHMPGRIEERSHFAWLIGRKPRDKWRYVVLDSAIDEAAMSWFAGVREQLGASARQEVYVFVHGFNESFRDAALRAAQAMIDLHLRSVPIIYSWASYGETLQYVNDLDASEQTADRLAHFLETVAANTGATRVNLLAHSMGNRALLRAVEKLHAAGHPLLGEVVMAAPDEDQQGGRTLLPALVAIASRVTLYASSRDKALFVSQNLLRDGRPRLGQAGRFLTVMHGVETVDVSDVDTDFLSHSYFGNSLQVLDDLRLLLNMGSAANDRLTSQRALNGKPYWWLPPRTN